MRIVRKIHIFSIDHSDDLIEPFFLDFLGTYGDIFETQGAMDCIAGTVRRLNYRPDRLISTHLLVNDLTLG